MANFPRNSRRAVVRRVSVLLTLILAGGGLVALEHTATGASTGTPSSYGDHHATTPTRQGRNGPHDCDPGRHHGSTTTMSSTTTTSTTTTTMPNDHCHLDH